MKLYRAATVFVYGLLVYALPARAESFISEVKPILESKCLSCHNQNNKKGDLSLVTKEDAMAYEKGIFSPTPLEENLILNVISHQGNTAPEMPKDSPPLSPDDVERIKTWIASGAPWPKDLRLKEASKAGDDWWAYQALRQSYPGGLSSIDQFINAKLVAEDLQLNPPADRRTLIRRATYDLTGLPPTPEQVEAFVSSPDPRAYEKLIDRLLASPRYGERWGRHWLDVVRFGESNGFERNVIINNLWPFRDYVIKSINDDKPFDQFIREHLAGDAIAEGRPEIEIGSAFLVAGPYDDVGNQDAVQAAQIRANTLDEMIRATTEAFLGMTVGCARCHDHKFDPIEQADYYRLYATFAGIRHGSADWDTPQVKSDYQKRANPLNVKKEAIGNQIKQIDEAILARAKAKAASYEAAWTRPKIERTGVEDTFPPISTKFVRIVSEGQDQNPNNKRNFNIDEFEIWSATPIPKNVALASNGTRASGEARQIEDFANAYDATIAIDGEFGARFIATAGSLMIELDKPTLINRIYFSSARGERVPTQGKFAFVGEYRIETSLDGETWQSIVNSHDRKPVNETFRNHRLRQAELSATDRRQLKDLRNQLAAVNRELKSIPRPKTAFLGRRDNEGAKGPFHIFRGGDPQRKGREIEPASLSTLSKVTPSYKLEGSDLEAARRTALAQWITHPENPLTARVLANRVWHYHFGTGIVDTPSDFGYMGGRPSHPKLLDFLASKLQQSGWRLKPLHKLIMLSESYQQSSAWKETAARIDGNSRLLWRFPPRRLAAEEIRDSILQVAGKLHHKTGGPGFRLYKFMQDNVSTYEPLDDHGPETYYRAVYHQNARAAVVDLMTDFDLPDCAFSTPRRAGTTSPLQALTLLNHQFTIDMSLAFAARLAPNEPIESKIIDAFNLAFQRAPKPDELRSSKAVIEQHGLRAFCRALLNTNELIYLD